LRPDRKAHLPWIGLFQGICTSIDVISKFIGIHQATIADNKCDILQKMRCGVSFTIDCDNPGFLLGKGKWPIQWSSKFFKNNKLKQFASQYELLGGQIQFNTVLKGEIIKIHGNPTINDHDWVIVSCKGKQHLCHIVCFVDISEVKKATVQVGKLDEPGFYGICHFVNQDVFSNAVPSNSMYGNGNYVSYRTDQNRSLIRGWAKFMEQINGPRIPHHMPDPSLAMFPVQSIISTCIGIEDCQNPIPHSYISFHLVMSGHNYFING